MYESFPTLKDFIETTNKEIPSDEVLLIFIAHLVELKNSLRTYVPCLNSGNNWIRDPFNTEVNNANNLSVFEEDSVVEMTYDTSLTPQFNKLNQQIFGWFLDLFTLHL